jgi:hypothetical protein
VTGVTVESQGRRAGQSIGLVLLRFYGLGVALLILNRPSPLVIVKPMGTPTDTFFKISQPRVHPVSDCMGFFSRVRGHTSVCKTSKENGTGKGPILFRTQKSNFVQHGISQRSVTQPQCPPNEHRTNLNREDLSENLAPSTAGVRCKAAMQKFQSP